jgi:hypothetical protein
MWREKVQGSSYKNINFGGLVMRYVSELWQGKNPYHAVMLSTISAITKIVVKGDDIQPTTITFEDRLYKDIEDVLNYVNTFFDVKDNVRGIGLDYIYSLTVADCKILESITFRGILEKDLEWEQGSEASFVNDKEHIIFCNKLGPFPVSRILINNPSQYTFNKDKLVVQSADFNKYATYSINGDIDKFKRLLSKAYILKN